MSWFVNRKSRIVGATAAVVLLAGFGWCVLPPSYAFRLQARTADRDDVFALMALAADLRQVQQWNPEFLSERAISDLSAWITYPTNLEAKSARELRRDGSKLFATINGQILLLELSNQGDLESLRKLPSPKMDAELVRRLTLCRDRRRDASLAKVVQLPANQRLLERCDGSPFPTFANPVRAILASTVGWRLEDRSRWVTGFLKAVDRDVAPSALQYAAMDRQNIVPLHVAGPSRLELHKRRQASTVPGTIYCGSDSTCDFDLRWIPVSGAEPGDASPQRAYDTGLRIVRMRWVQDGTGGANWRTDWPPTPAQIGCRPDRLKEFLREFGLPMNLVIRTGSMAVKGTWQQCDLELLVELSSEDFPDWQHRLTLPLSGQSAKSFRQDLVQRVTEHDEKLLAHVAAQKTLCHLPAEISRPSGSDRSIEATVQHPQFGSLRLRGTLGHDGRFAWEPKLTVADRVRIVESLAKAHPSLAGLVSRIVLTGTHVEPAKDRIAFDFRLAPQPGQPEAPEPIQWSVAGTQPTDSSVSVPDSIPVVVPPRQPAAGASKPTAWSRDELGREIPKILAEDYPRLAGFVTFAAQMRPEGIELRLGLQIADWKELELGPVVISKVDELRPELERLLSSESVKQAADVQWKQVGEFHHPRFGKITAELADWSPREPRARVRCVLKLRDLGEIPWFEDTRLNGEEWSQLDSGLLADKLEPQVTESLANLHRLISDYIPADSIELRLDRTGIDGNRWLDLDPPRIALEGTARVNMFGLDLPAMKIGGILIDTEGLHIPEEYGFALPVTMPLSYFAVSEPSLMISLSNPSLRVGGKITPPVGLIGAARNPWLDVFYNESSLRGYWERPQFDGESSVALVRTPDVASGTAIANFKTASMMGELRGGGRLPGLPSVPARLGGRMEASGSTKSVEVQTRAQVFEKEVGALTLDAGGTRKRPSIDERFEDPYGFGVRGKVRVPMIATVNVNGEATSALDQYTIKGRGAAGPFSCHLTATEKDVRVERAYHTERSATYWDEWDPNLITLNQPDPVGSGAGGSGLDPGLSGRAASDGEQQFAQRTFNVRPDPAPNEAQSPAVESVRPDKYQELTGTIFRRGAGASLQAFSGERLVVEIPQSSLPESNLADWNVYIWSAADASGHALFVHRQAQRAAHVAFSGPTATAPLRDISLLNLPVSTDEQKLLAQRVLRRYFRLSVLDAEDVQDVTTPLWMSSLNAVGYEYKLRADPQSSIWALFTVQATPIALDLHATAAGINGNLGELDPKVASLLWNHRPTQALPRVILVEEEKNATGWYISESREAAGGSVSLVRGEGQILREEEFAFHAPDVTFAQRLRSARCLARAALLNDGLAKGHAWFGTRGVMVESEGTLWIIRDRGTRDPQVDRLSRVAFDNWASDSASKLPEDWRTVEQRRELDVKTIAATALSERFATADRRVEPVNRLGLLQTLARELESTQP